ncbi:hypothetical protein MKZ38_000543 [Zalerion maritima]|uniref:RRN6 beta-propeller domain-containing protein n=1 Tax=Zalerion maritima TaxID=339359 RepID=A0AAD5WTZ4_9PEZI|nr:hypothetical protein MKZ38_000543 [Zalerion maritima]
MPYGKQNYRGLAERVAQDRHGNPGSIIYKPLEKDHPDRGNEWHLSGRWTNPSMFRPVSLLLLLDYPNHDLEPAFQQLSSFAEWHYPTKPDTTSAFPKNLRPVRVQQRWLYSHIPEAAAGVDEIAPLLAQTHREPESVKEPSTRHPVMALGHVEGYKKTVSDVLVMATATGRAGHILRLNTLTDMSKQWERGDKVNLRVHTGPAEEAFWSENASPISNVVFFEGRSRTRMMRFLMVQQPAATTLFRPIIHKMPVEGKGRLPAQRPSFLEANPIFTLKAEKTGGSRHTDVAYNDGAERQDPQVAVIDESGCWSVWDIKLFKKTLRPGFVTCGHVKTGFLPKLPPADNPTGERFRVLWVRRPEVNLPYHGDADEGHVPSSQGPFLGPGVEFQRTRSHHLMICDNTTLKVTDIQRHKFSPTLSISARGVRDRIVCIKACPLGTSLVFVLTEKTIRLIDTLPSTDEGQLGRTMPRTILSIPHNRSKDDDLLLDIAPDTHKMYLNGFVTVYIYSTRNTVVDFIWFKLLASEPQSAQFYHLPYILSDDCLYKGDKIGGGFRSLSFHPTVYKARKSKNRVGGPGHEYFYGFVQFYEIFSQDQRLAVRHAIGSVFKAGSSLLVFAPEIDVSRKAKKYLEHSQVFKYTAETFTTPDSFALFDITGLREQHPLIERVLDEEESKRELKNITRLVAPLLRLLKARETLNGDIAGAPAWWHRGSPVASIEASLGDFAVELPRRIPLTTLREIAYLFNITKRVEEFVPEWNAALHALEHASPLLTLSAVNNTTERCNLLQLYLRLKSAYIQKRRSVPPDGRRGDVNHIAEQAIREAACDIFLSSYTIIETRLLSPPPREINLSQGKQLEGMDGDSLPPMTLSSQDQNPLLTPRMTPSEPITPTPEPPNLTNPSLDDALDRLSTLALSSSDPSQPAAVSSRPSSSRPSSSRSAKNKLNLTTGKRSTLISRWTLNEDMSSPQCVKESYSWTHPESEELAEWRKDLLQKREIEREKKRRKMERYRTLGILPSSDAAAGVAGPSSSQTQARSSSQVPIVMGPPERKRKRQKVAGFGTGAGVGFSVAGARGGMPSMSISSQAMSSQHLPLLLQTHGGSGPTAVGPMSSQTHLQGSAAAAAAAADAGAGVAGSSQPTGLGISMSQPVTGAFGGKFGGGVGISKKGKGSKSKGKKRAKPGF